MSGTQMPTQQSLDAFRDVFNGELKKLNVETFLGSHPDILAISAYLASLDPGAAK
jgi:hypothetical protein